MEELIKDDANGGSDDKKGTDDSSSSSSSSSEDDDDAGVRAQAGARKAMAAFLRENPSSSSGPSYSDEVMHLARRTDVVHVVFSRRQFEVLTKLILNESREAPCSYGRITFYPLSGHVVLEKNAGQVAIKAVHMSKHVDIFRSDIYHSLWRSLTRAGAAIAACRAKPNFVLFNVGDKDAGLHWYNYDAEAMVHHVDGLSGGRCWHGPSARPYEPHHDFSLPEKAKDRDAGYTVPCTYAVRIEDSAQGISAKVSITLYPDQPRQTAGAKEDEQTVFTLSDKIRLLDDMVKNYGARIIMGQF
jgi:hypothetical protein